uniref:Glycolipid transfer protein domain-containing protein n=1 Tax=Kalanchoe fedtschenkoi TaxID=63787 RepID=A0A7N0UB52_KALFE
MERRRESERGSEMKFAIEELSLAVKVKQPRSEEDEGAFNDSVHLQVDAFHVPIKPFLSVCSFVLQVLDKIGPTMAVLRQDIQQNIQRLEAVHDLNEMLNKEKIEGNARKSDSCSRAFVWLTRTLDFTVAMLQKLADEPAKTTQQEVEESYAAILKPWHGWISCAAYKVALKMVPDRKSLMTLLVNKNDNFETLIGDFKSKVSSLMPLLDDAHNIMVSKM